MITWLLSSTENTSSIPGRFNWAWLKAAGLTKKQKNMKYAGSRR